MLHRGKLFFRKIKTITNHINAKILTAINSNFNALFMAGDEGIEPSTAVLETAIIPLN